MSPILCLGARLFTDFNATLLARQPLPGGHLLLRLSLRLDLPVSAALFHINDLVFSLMRVDSGAGYIELYGHGLDTAATADWECGRSLSGQYQLGQPTVPVSDRPQLLLVGVGPGIGTILHLAASLRGHTDWQPLVLLGTDTGFPFLPRPSRYLVSGLPRDVIAAAPLLEDWGMPSRLCSKDWLPGCFEGDIGELLGLWLQANGASATCQILAAAGADTLANLVNVELPLTPLPHPDKHLRADC